MLTGKFNKYLRFGILFVAVSALALSGPAMHAMGFDYFDTVGFPLMIAAYCIILYKDKLSYKIIVALLMELSVMIVDSSVTPMINALFPNAATRLGESDVLKDPIIIFLLVVISSSLAVFCFFFNLLIQKLMFKKASGRSLLIFGLFPVGQLLLLICFIKAKDQHPEDFTMEMAIWIIVSLAVSLIGDVLCYKGLIQNSELSIVKMRNDHLEREREAQYKYYEKISEMQGEMMKYNHDFKNALQTAYALCESSDELSRKSGAEMLDTLKSRSEKIKAPFFCANPIVNTVLWDKSDEAKKLGIDLEVDASISDTGIDSVDLCCLIANAVDNALRGVENTAEKKVEVKIKQEGKRVFMTVRNSASLPDFESSDRIPTTKVGKNHGYGTEIIKNIAERRNGDVLFSCKDNVFTCMATLSED